MFKECLADSSLIGFKAPLFSSASLGLNEFVTARTHAIVQSITINHLEVNDILITCRPNIWSMSNNDQAHNYDSVNTQKQYAATNFNMHLSLLPNGRHELPSFANNNFNFDFDYDIDSDLESSKDSNVFDYNFYGNNDAFYSATAASSIPPSPSTPVLSFELEANSHVFKSNVGKDFFHNNFFEVPKNSRFFVIKSYNLLDVESSIKHGIWSSTDLGNKRLNKAMQELKNLDPRSGKIFLFFLVNASGKFSGICEMKEEVDFTKSSDVWIEESRWKGVFPVEWLIVKDIPNKHFHHLRIPLNEYKSITNSRDTQEVPIDVAISVLKIYSTFK